MNTSPLRSILFGGFVVAAAAAVAAPASATTTPSDSAAEGTASATGFVGSAPCGFCELLTDGAGMTLYIFTPDPVGESTCTGDCQANWPPLFVDGDALPDGLDPALYSLVAHPDGNVLAINGKALYYFAGDAAPGDTNGQAVGDVWWAVSPTGTFYGPAQAPADAAAPTTPATTATGGY